MTPRNAERVAAALKLSLQKRAILVPPVAARQKIAIEQRHHPHAPAVARPVDQIGELAAGTVEEVAIRCLAMGSQPAAMIWPLARTTLW